MRATIRLTDQEIREIILKHLETAYNMETGYSIMRRPTSEYDWPVAQKKRIPLVFTTILDDKEFEIGELKVFYDSENRP